MKLEESFDMQKKYEKPKPGDLIEIDIEGGFFCYARCLTPPVMAFYDCKLEHPTNIKKITSNPIIFTICVYHHATTSGRWRIIENLPLEEELRRPVIFFRQDALSGKTYKHHEDGSEFLCPKSECEGLERAAVWEPSHVEDRLRDHFNETPNKWTESLKVK